MRSRARLSLAALCLTCAVQASAQEVRLLVQVSPLAGFRYHEAPKVLASLVPGEALELVREPGNVHDGNAVRVEWRGHKLGYLPRSQNAAIAWAMDRGEIIEARVRPLEPREARVAARPRPGRRVELEVFVR